MKARIKFQKYGVMKFIGHLDVMRYFQKAFRRAEFDNVYSKGFSPHQVMSFAAPLGVGLTSDGEYLDVELNSSDSCEVMMKRLNEVMVDGFHITGFRMLLEREENKKAVTAMSLVSYADYLVSLKDGYDINDTIRSQESFEKVFRKFIKEDEIIIGKKTKTKETQVDIKPMITLAAFNETEYQTALQNTLKGSRKDTGNSVADVYDNGIKVYLQLNTGSAANLKPEIVMEAFYAYLDLQYNKFSWQVHRIEVYTREEESGKLIPLDCLER